MKKQKRRGMKLKKGKSDRRNSHHLCDPNLGFARCTSFITWRRLTREKLQFHDSERELNQTILYCRTSSNLSPSISWTVSLRQLGLIVASQIVNFEVTFIEPLARDQSFFVYSAEWLLPHELREPLLFDGFLVRSIQELMAHATVRQ
jgi:hypothetical protein